MNQKTAIVLVHGVGDPLPGDALRRLIESLQAGDEHSSFRLDGPVTVGHLDAPNEPQAEPDRVNGFPVTRASLIEEINTTKRRHECWEVYWGDLSRVKQSVSALLYSLFDFIFGLRHIVEEATRLAPPGMGKWSGYLASTSLWTARGPMFAVNIQLAITCLLYAGLLQAPGKLKPEEWAPQVAMGVASAAVVVAGCLAWVRVKRLEWSQATAGAMVIVGGLSAVYTLVFSSKLNWISKAYFVNLNPYVNFMTTVMTIGAMFMVFVGFLAVTSAAISWCCAAISSKFADNSTAARERSMPPLVIAFCTSLSICLFVFAVIACWTVIVKTIEPDPEIVRFACLETSSAGVQFQECINGKKSPVDQLADRIRQGVHLLPVIVLIFLVAALIYLGIVGVNWAIGKFPRCTKTPRLRYIVSPAVIAWFTVASTVGGLVFLILSYKLLWLGACNIEDGSCLESDAQRWVGLPGWFVDLLKSLPEYTRLKEHVIGIKELDDLLKPVALSLTVAVAAVVVASRAHFLTALDLVLDVISHFRTAPGLQSREDSKRFTQWNAMVERFRRVVHDAIAEPEVSRLVVISHSQGTMIALHGLGLLKVGHWQPDPQTKEGLDIELVTMGSPLTSLYRHYLPQKYTLCLGDGHTGVRTWINIHRIDDFIGTDVKLTHEEALADTALGPGRPAEASAPTSFLRNFNVGTGGHTDYWVDRRVLKKILPLLRHVP